MTAYESISLRLTTTTPIMPEHSSSIQQQLEVCERFINTLFSSENHSINCFIKSRLKQLKLASDYDNIDVISKARHTARKKILEGERVKNLGAWFRVICLYKIKELYRQKKQDIKIIQKLKFIDEDYTRYNLNLNYATQQNIEALTQAWENLNEIDRRVLILREVEGLEWKEVADELISWGYFDVKDSKLIARLRKRGNRALDKLRKAFFDLLKEN